MTDERYHTGLLRKMETGRWSIGHDYEITSGEVIEVKVGACWITTRIESASGEYYPVVSGIQLHEGMLARQRRGPS